MYVVSLIICLAELVAGMLAHMAADRSMSHSLNDAREAVSKISADEATNFIFSYHMRLVTL